MYNLYILSCYRDDDFLVSKHDGWYHYISKTVKGFTNKERKLRQELDLYDYYNEPEWHDYRDVRQYKKEYIIREFGFIEDIETYKFRRYNFESLLYCILREKALPVEDEFKNYYKKLIENKSKIFKYYKDTNKINLIFKSYWLDGIDPL